MRKFIKRVEILLIVFMLLVLSFRGIVKATEDIERVPLKKLDGGLLIPGIKKLLGLPLEGLDNVLGYKDIIEDEHKDLDYLDYAKLNVMKAYNPSEELNLDDLEEMVAQYESLYKESNIKDKKILLETLMYNINMGRYPLIKVKRINRKKFSDVVKDVMDDISKERAQSEDEYTYLIVYGYNMTILEEELYKELNNDTSGKSIDELEIFDRVVDITRNINIDFENFMVYDIFDGQYITDNKLSNYCLSNYVKEENDICKRGENNEEFWLDLYAGDSDECLYIDSIDSIVSVKIEAEKTEIEVGEELNLNAILEPDNVIGKTIEWKSNNEDIAVVNGNGKVIGKTMGEVTITATSSNGKTATIKINIKEKKAEKIEIAGAESLKVGERLKLKAIITPENTTNKGVLWTSSNTTVATIDDTGKVEAKAEGETIITATTSNHLQATLKITIQKNEKEKKEPLIIKVINKIKTFFKNIISKIFKR